MAPGAGAEEEEPRSYGSELTQLCLRLIIGSPGLVASRQSSGYPLRSPVAPSEPYAQLHCTATASALEAQQPSQPTAWEPPTDYLNSREVLHILSSYFAAQLSEEEEIGPFSVGSATLGGPWDTEPLRDTSDMAELFHRAATAKGV